MEHYTRGEGDGDNARLQDGYAPSTRAAVAGGGELVWPACAWAGEAETYDEYVAGSAVHMRVDSYSKEDSASPRPSTVGEVVTGRVEWCVAASCVYG